MQITEKHRRLYRLAKLRRMLEAEEREAPGLIVASQVARIEARKKEIEREGQHGLDKDQRR